MPLDLGQTFRDPKIAGAGILAAAAAIFGRARRRMAAVLSSAVAGYALGAFAPAVVQPVIDRLAPNANGSKTSTTSKG